MKTKLFITAAIAALALTAPAHAETGIAKGDWLVRLRGILIAPTGSSGGINPMFPASTVDINTKFVPELDFTYMFTDNIGAELILATSKHSATGASGALAGQPLLSAWVLPPTLTLQYHFMPKSAVRPYVGAGINYTIYYSESASSFVNSALGATDVSMSSSFGWAAQAGFDVDVSPKVFLNFDVKYIDMGTTATLTTGAVVNKVDVNINPIVAGVGLGMRF
ncbi:OmpW family protein [Polymorphobacter arshaanensis]|uniref:OmpW family protein n=1 Tax=Glacieibacterium arshaanense TaxID=2511025 RepID=A0A4Y9EN35_9SPHN|nr:OmpW family outer membrane protein [Polymorphobacter arshaanensis]TFU03475.1 OmpW family protein [Polymorphobacter arshaanensis]